MVETGTQKHLLPEQSIEWDGGSDGQDWKFVRLSAGCQFLMFISKNLHNMRFNKCIYYIVYFNYKTLLFVGILYFMCIFSAREYFSLSRATTPVDQCRKSTSQFDGMGSQLCTHRHVQCWEINPHGTSHKLVNHQLFILKLVVIDMDLPWLFVPSHY